MRGKLKEIKEEMRHRMHQPIPEQGRWLAQVVRGYFAYHAVPTNSASIGAFRHHVVALWRSSLLTGFLSRKSFFRGRSSALPSDTRGRSRMPELGSYGSVRGAAGNSRPYRERQEAPHAQLTGVQKAPRHEVAGSRAPAKQRAL